MPEPAPDLSAGGAGPDLHTCTLRFQSPVLARSVGQLVTSFGGFFAACAAMYALVSLSVWVALPVRYGGDPQPRHHCQRTPRLEPPLRAPRTREAAL